MVQINSSGVTEMFTGAYNKRVEQNKSKAAAETYHGQQKEQLSRTAKDMLGASVSISSESQKFMAGVKERKAAQIAAKAEAERECQGNAFSGTGDFKQQYLIFSENLYNNGFYDNMSDDEVYRMESLLKDITSGMDSINSSGLNRSFEMEMSHEAAKLALVSSVNALNYFTEKYVPEEIQDSFQNLIKQYESYNSAKTAVHKNIYDMRDESMSKISIPNAVHVSEAVRKTQEDTKVSREIGKVTHTKEEEEQNKADYQALFEQLMQRQKSTESIFENLQNKLVQFASGGSKNSNVLAVLNTRNASAISDMAGYWSKLL